MSGRPTDARHGECRFLDSGESVSVRLPDTTCSRWRRRLDRRIAETAIALGLAFTSMASRRRSTRRPGAEVLHNINGSDLLVVRPEATIAMSVPRAVQHPIRLVKIPCHVHHRAETHHAEKLLDLTLG